MTVYACRKKLEPQNEVPSSRVDGAEHIRDVQEPEADSQSVFQVEVPPWAENYDVSSIDAEGVSWSAAVSIGAQSLCQMIDS